MLSSAYGIQNLLKEGYRHYAGLEEAILRNIEACKGVSNLTKTSFGPNGMKKLVVNHIDKLFVTNDAATILREVEVHHPAARLIAMAAKMQKEDFGDFTNYVVTFAGELLVQAEALIRTGLHPSAIISGYELGLAEALRILEEQVSETVSDPSNEESVVKVIESTLAPKLPTYYKFFAKLATKACLAILQENSPRFNAENIRLVKIIGGSLEDSELVKGFVIPRNVESFGKEVVEKANVAVFGVPFDPQEAETKGTILINNATDLLNFTKTEETYAEKLVKSLVESGVNVVVAGGSISELCMHYLNKYGLMVVRVTSKFDLQRLAKCVNAVVLAKLQAPTKDEMGYCDSVKVKEIGSTRVTVFEKDVVNSQLVTIILRGSTMSVMDNVERALENGLSAFKQILHDGRYVQGAGAIESYLVNRIESFATSQTGLEQYSCLKFGQAFEVVPKILIDNAGLNPNTELPTVLSANVDKPRTGVDVFNGKLEDSSKINVIDNLSAKINAIQLAAHAALTVLRVDQIIMAKPAGGPKMPNNSGWDNHD